MVLRCHHCSVSVCGKLSACAPVLSGRVHAFSVIIANCVDGLGRVLLRPTCTASCHASMRPAWALGAATVAVCSVCGGVKPLVVTSGSPLHCIPARLCVRAGSLPTTGYWVACMLLDTVVVAFRAYKGGCWGCFVSNSQPATWLLVGWVAGCTAAL